jgi:hypothetical protein
MFARTVALLTVFNDQLPQLSDFAAIPCATLLEALPGSASAFQPAFEAWTIFTIQPVELASVS